MRFLKDFFCVDDFFKDSSVVGLSSLKKKNEYVYVEIPREFRTTVLTNTARNNYLFI